MTAEMAAQTCRAAAGLIVAAALAAGLAAAAHAGAATYPPGFDDTLVASVPGPTDIAFTPDGRMLVTRQLGVVLVLRDGVVQSPAALTMPSTRLCTNLENGILGITADPAFASNRYVYLHYTFKRPDAKCVTRISRFVLGDDDVIAPASEVVLLDNIPAPNGNHGGGSVRFGPDGMLYVSTGDGGCDYAGDSGCQINNDAARDKHVLLGKILRITRDGAVPPDNPFVGSGSASCAATGMTTAGLHCSETWAWGLRNPFRITFDPNSATPRLFIDDTGQNEREEIDLGVAGADYGWFCFEGTRRSSTRPQCYGLDVTWPIYEYRHDDLVPGTSVTGCGAITGGAFVPNGLWPGYDGAYLFGDFNCGAVFALRESSGTWSASDFVTGLGVESAVTMIFGPSPYGQSLYYTSWAGGGQVRRIDYTGGDNRAPAASATAAPTSGPAPLTVAFDASASSDPDGDALTYLWSFGDGSAQLVTDDPTVSHSYTQGGEYDAVLRVRDPDLALSAPVTLRISVDNSPPSPTIAAPAAGATFRVGETITLAGSASDVEDGALPPSALSWTVVRHHDDHGHPFLPPTSGNGVGFTAPGPEDLPSAPESWLIVRLTATDSDGAAATVERAFHPQLVTLDFASDPPGATVRVENSPVTAPTSVASWAGWEITLEAADQTIGGVRHRFLSWSDGGAATHRVLTPSSPASFAVTFQPALFASDFENGTLVGSGWSTSP